MATSTPSTEEEGEEENVGISNSVSSTAMSAATFILVAASYSLSLAAFFGCSFYSVTSYNPTTGAQYTEYGVSFCKWDILQGGLFLESAIDTAANWMAALAPCFGLVGFIMLCCSRPRYCECCCCLSGTWSFAATMCAFLAVSAILQFLSILVLASPYCGTKYNGSCQLQRDGWLSVSAAILWMVSAFAAWNIPKSDLD
jgi:hypothetical protein